MNRKSKILMLIAALLLIGAYVLPIWEISLQAPQYPEGLGLKIWISTIGGQNPGDLEKVNNLNHYIGMKEIIPEAIPELKVMPYLIGLLLVSGLLVAWSGKRWLLYAWVIIFLAIGTTGLIDFYLWEYDYGHDLNPRAAIKIPGMAYQPPLIGSKQILNFVATSLPGFGGYLLLISMLLGLIAAYGEFKSPAQKSKVINNESTDAASGKSDNVVVDRSMRTGPKAHPVRA